MKVTIKGKFAGQEPWELETEDGKTLRGHTLGIQQGINMAKVSVRHDEAPASWPEEGAQVEIEATIRAGWKGQGFKASVESMNVNGRPVGAATK